MSTHYNTYEKPKRKAQELKYQLNTFINFIESATDGIIFVQDGLIKYVNESAAKLVGHSPDELIGTSFERFIHPDDLKNVMEAYEKRLKEENIPSRYELRIVGKGGKITHVEVNADIADYKGKIATISVIRDISERKKLLEEVQEKANFLENLFENSPEAVVLLDNSGHVIRINKEFERMFGHKISEMEGKLLDPFVARGDLLKEAEQIRKRTDKGEKIELETIRVKKDGSLFNVQITESPIRSGDKVVGKYVIYRDISAREKAEAKFKESEKKYRELVELAETGIIIDDKDGNIVYANKHLAKIFGYDSIKEVKKLTIYDYVHPDDREKVINYHQRRISGKKAPSRYEFKGIRKDGKAIYLEVSVSPIVTEKGIIGTRSYIWDITDRKKMENTLEKALKEKSIMLQEIHHRVKNNMQIIISLMRIQARRAKHKEIKEHLRALQDRVFSMAHVHEYFYRHPELDKINIASYIKGIVDHLCFMRNKSEKEIKVNLDLEEIHLDLNKAVPFGILLNEIITNILKHAFPGKKKGELSIRLYRDGNKKIRLYVADNGNGIPEHVDLNNPETMGLQLINDLTHQLEGEIKIKSDKGTRINLIFPEKN